MQSDSAEGSPKLPNRTASPEAAAKAALLSYFVRKGEPLAVASELTLQSFAFRADLVLVRKTTTTAVEIKTATDKLTRLSKQLTAYSAVFNKVYAAVATRHLKKAIETAPRHVGIIELQELDGIIVPRLVRAARGCKTDRHALLQLLPAFELKRLVRAAGKSAPGTRRADVAAAASTISHNAISKHVRAFLVSRFGATSKSIVARAAKGALAAKHVGTLSVWTKQSKRTKAPQDVTFSLLLKQAHARAHALVR